MRSYRPEELFDEEGRLLPELAAQAPAGDRRMSANPHANGGILLRDLVLPDFRDYAVDVEKPATTFSEATRVLGGFLRDVVEPQRRQLPPLRPGRDGVEPARRRLLGHGSHLAGGDESGRRAPLPGRPGDGDPLRAPLPGLARGVPPDRPPRALQLLRGVHPHRRLDVQPAREVAQGDRAHPLAAPDRLAQLPAQLARLAAGSQRLLPPGSRLHRPRCEQEGGGDPRLPAAGREHPALGRRPLPAQPQLRQRDRRGQAARTQLPLDRRRDPPLHARARDLGLGVERRGRRARCRAGLRRRHADARDARGGGDPARAAAGAEGAGRERRRPDAPAAGHRAPARSLRRALRLALHGRQADRLRLPRLPLADPPPHLPADEPSTTCMCAATRKRARRRRRSTW